ncbi:hypothetical protein QP868_11885, partial [Brevibacterium sp. UMB1308A]|uniref:hypothetical protein n=1 Tax=Brevibacterium sp. UMB1308A TaxID=3050608 RepID=UPI00254DFBE2
KSRDIVHSMSRDFLRFGVLMCRVIVPLFCVWGSCFWLVVFGGVDGVFGDDFSGCFVDCDGVGSGAAWGRGVAGMRRLATVEFDFGARLYPKEPKTVARVTI